MTAEQVREDLRKIRYYYSKKTELDTALDIVPNQPISILVDKYNKAIKMADIRLYATYVKLYVKNETQMCYAIEDNISLSYVKLLSKLLIEYFVENL